MARTTSASPAEVRPTSEIRYGPLRDLIAFVVVALACPVAVFGGANLGCVGSASFSGACAVTVIAVSPIVLLAGGTVAGLVSRGWTGLLVVLVGMITGMFGILLLSIVAGKPVPVDWFSAIAATCFFGIPIVIGYAIGRTVMRLRETRS